MVRLHRRLVQFMFPIFHYLMESYIFHLSVLNEFTRNISMDQGDYKYTLYT